MTQIQENNDNNTNYNTCKKGSLGWIKEQAKKDGFDNIRDWIKYQSIGQVKNIDQVRKILEENNVKIKDSWEFYNFWSKVDIKDNKDCWNWTSTVELYGYGQSWYKHKARKSHRQAYKLTKGNIPKGLEVQHLCNNRLCCNPSHLILGNHTQNMEHMVKCDRSYNAKGENHGMSKLTEDEVREIHQLYIEDELNKTDIAKIFEIRVPTLNCIIKGKTWYNIYEEYNKHCPKL